jgi:hypothetical protein
VLAERWVLVWVLFDWVGYKRDLLDWSKVRTGGYWRIRRNALR